ncbi:YbfB/YjiJ family MFS transporter [Pseudomonas bijieensis]|jgi:predicted MFS family arabinose efflux permease|uniref:YbfB/YjiJ family MFS transporter n=1 Tax=Pseudomonas bijieensis TaxID=2681983 RepID=A0A6N1CK74_9PSED|nr:MULTISPECIES: YbfB/YjiJ family MFS transporter [Pseudomonas]PWJ31651.1 putative MFS family arabinose efflux permease [Pseudomonas sp. 43mfcvi1.1]QKS85709.1 YbfB/YjiJ family MFS transporter [Pseudomonas bijieensis]SSB98851.1 Predicted arabinose efflux permease, MFS family [Pseudomonas sp. 43mfcvi1.1]
MTTPSAALDSAPTGIWLPIFAGLCASLVSIGLARFAYTPLIPSLIEAHWFSANDVVYLGAANLVGYLVGALLGRPMAHRLTNRNALRLMMLAVTGAFFACAFPLSVTWYFAWRLLSGIAGGAIMVLVAATVLPHVPAARKGLASGAIFLGIGLGIAGSGTIVPPLLSLGLQATWLGLGALSLVLTGLSWFGWPQDTAHVAASAAPDAPMPAAVFRLFAQYAFMAAGLVPAMVFLVDYVARGLGAGAHVGALVWVMYGLGAIIGPVSYGFLADHLGARRSIRLVLLVQAIALGLLAISQTFMALALLAVVIGSFPPGIVPLALARVHELIPNHHRQQLAWSRATVSFATFQAVAGFAYSALFNASGGHHALLFLISAGAILVALTLDFTPWGNSKVLNS